jgi:Tfp pilus assembly protein PilO
MKSRSGVFLDLRASLLRSLQRAGWAGALGVGLMAFALAFGYTVSTDQTRRQEQLAAERSLLLKAASGSAADQRPDAERLAAFYARFPALDELPARLQELHRLAETHGVVLARADYRASRDAGTGLSRVSLSLPASGAFEPVYQWLAEVLATMPEVALESLSIKREDTAAGEVEVELRLAIFLRGQA